VILRVLRLEVSVYNVYITNQFQTTFTVKSDSRGDCEWQGGKLFRLLPQHTSKNSDLVKVMFS
jgi:hypothetical protein